MAGRPGDERIDDDDRQIDNKILFLKTLRLRLEK